MNLLRTELVRIRERRISAVIGGLTLAIIALVGITQFATHSGETFDMAIAESDAAASEATCRSMVAASDDPGMPQGEAIDDWCYADPAWYVQDRSFHASYILDSISPMHVGIDDPAWADVRNQRLERQPFVTSEGTEGVVAASGFSGILPAMGIALAIVAGIAGASWTGADWRSGVVESQMVVEPRRRRLFGAKLGAVAVTAAAYGAIGSALTVAVLAPSIWWRGDMALADGRFWWDVVAMTGRITVACAAVAALAAAIAFATRHTVAAVAAVLGAYVVGAVLTGISGLFASIAPAEHLAAWVDGGDVARWVDYPSSFGGTETWMVAVRSSLLAGAATVGATIVLVGVSALAFQRRDVA